MKKFLTTLTTIMLLLMVSPMVSAQTSGKVVKKGTGSLIYNFSGGTIIDQEEPVAGIQRHITCQVTPGTTITFQCQADGKDRNGSPRIVKADIHAYTGKNSKGVGYSNNYVLYSKYQDDASVLFSYTVPEKAGFVSIYASIKYDVGYVPAIQVDFQVIKDKPAPTPSPASTPETEVDADINNHYSNKSQEIEDGVYIIRFSHDPVYVLTLKDGKAVNDNIVHLWKNRNDNSQKWKVTHEKGKIAIRSMIDPSYSLDVKSFNYSNNTEIILYKYHGGDNQLWIPERLDNGSFIVKTAGDTSFCLDLYMGDAKNGGIIELYTVHKEWPEWWTFEKVSK